MKQPIDRTACEGTSFISASEAVEEAILRAGERFPQLRAIEVLALEPGEGEGQHTRLYRARVRPRSTKSAGRREALPPGLAG